MNLPNGLTILRIILVPIFINLMVYGHHDWALAVFVVAGATDGLDGMVARITNQRTRLGSYLDPIADKMLLTASFVVLAVFQFIPVWAAVVVASRDLILILGALILHLTDNMRDVSPTWWGKGTTLTQILYVASVMVFLVFDFDLFPILPLLLVTMGLTVFSGLHYIYRGFRFLNGPGL
ncbi:MAG TPA: CDP-alcohol phosphatidyltransferase family protein [Nitrospiria bacterium]